MDECSVRDAIMLVPSANSATTARAERILYIAVLLAGKGLRSKNSVARQELLRSAQPQKPVSQDFASRAQAVRLARAHVAAQPRSAFTHWALTPRVSAGGGERRAVRRCRPARRPQPVRSSTYSPAC